jgi:molecular chaperone IbpA
MTTVDGFDKLHNILDNYALGFDWLPSVVSQAGLSYPPYNIVKTSDTEYEIDLAVAGFSKDNISISEDKDLLVISGELTDEVNKSYRFIHKGIAGRKFKREFAIGKNIRVVDASMDNGILKVRLIDERQNNIKSIPIL